MNRIMSRAVARAEISGAGIKTLAVAAVRATREGTIAENGDRLPGIIGTPIAGETLGARRFDGDTEIALFPGDLPRDPHAIFRPIDDPPKEPEAASPVRFMRFRPPALERTAEGLTLSLPHIRLDRALDYLIGDRLA